MIKDGLLTEKGKPNEKTPSEWYAKIGVHAKVDNEESAKQLKSQLLGEPEQAEAGGDEGGEEVEGGKKKKKKSKKVCTSLSCCCCC